MPGQGEYVYNHFEDNCTSRIRDYLDEASSGELREPIPLPPPFGTPGREPTFRSDIRRGLYEDRFLLWLSDVGVGSVADQPISSFDAMFLPGALRYGVEQAFDAPPGNSTPAATVICCPRIREAVRICRGSSPLRRSSRCSFCCPGRSGLRRAGVGAAAVLMAAVGVIATFVLAVSPLPEFRTSLLALAVPPSDLLLATRHARWYGPARLVWGAGFLVAILAGVLRQPLGWTVLATLLPVAAIVWRQRRSVEVPYAR